ncbi:reactive intermediate/imine deaminase [Saccharomonospora amisosensis]|uniref:Reactive intermediate/imine deaminase n=1 Tax=Saccharomonospora amisosensis TaxID=1128677 RepID=A0A7X5ZRY4_9PSEU|nr:RidA family protein [Saccharomonospora amisosensis]NIJ13347.1 reactive intermediate/imine deaminase [Saccharomonospora amisosensis]
MTLLQRVEHDPDWYEPYRISLAIKANGLIFVSGQAGIDEHGRTVGVGDFETQARQAFRNLAAVLEQGGSSLNDVVKVTIMVTDMSYLDQIVRLREEYFTAPYPADTLLRVAGLAQPDWLVEIDAIAVAG